MKKIVVCASGRGSNFEALVKASQKNFFEAEIIALITNNKEVRALDIAKNSKINHFVISDHQKLFEKLKELNPDLIVLAGYMRVLPHNIVAAFRNKIINIHPSLLPSFPGIHAQKQAMERGVKISGCTVHFVDEGVDHGPIILQSALPVQDSDTLDSLSERILEKEHDILCEAVKLYCENKLVVHGCKVYIEN